MLSSRVYLLRHLLSLEYSSSNSVVKHLFPKGCREVSMGIRFIQRKSACKKNLKVRTKFEARHEWQWWKPDVHRQKSSMIHPMSFGFSYSRWRIGTVTCTNFIKVSASEMGNVRSPFGIRYFSTINAILALCENRAPNPTAFVFECQMWISTSRTRNLQHVP